MTRSTKNIFDQITVKPVLETTYIKQSSALRDHCSDTTTLLESLLSLKYSNFFSLTQIYLR